MVDKQLTERFTEDAVELLKEMVAIPSPSFSESAVCDHISGWMTARGLVHERIGNNLVAEHIADPSRPTLMLCAHMDTVSPSDGYEFDPYEPDYVTAADVIGRMAGKVVGPEDIVAGLGSNDDGASVVSMLAAYRYYSGRYSGCENNPSHFVGPSPCGQGGSTVSPSVQTAHKLR